MNKAYQPLNRASDPMVSLQIPSRMHHEISLKAQENGRKISTEICIRLSRSLQNDAETAVNDKLYEDIFTVLADETE